MRSLEEVESLLGSAGQSHVLRFWSELSEEERSAFLSELSQLDLDALQGHCEAAAAAAASPPQPPAAEQHTIEPVPEDLVGSVLKSDAATLADWENEGMFQISEGRVGVLLLAGGQGTRLGVPYPKGMYDVGLPSGKTLYQIQSERIRKIQKLADVRHDSTCTVPWYIMTSEFTLKPTKRFFEENDYFGLDPSNVVMFEQRMVPAVGFDGKVILEDKAKIAMAPDGNGGLYQALADNKVLEDMERRGVEYLHVYCVDNILVKLADPHFIGFCVSKVADCGAKVVAKASPSEAVGVVCQVDGVVQVVEYSEIRPETAERQGADGELLFSAGNICNHFFTRGFLLEVIWEHEEKLKQHIALKKVPFIDECGNHVKPSEPNGIKMEKFNADGASTDTPTTARRSLLAQHHRWALAAGASFSDEHGTTLLARDWSGF
ncbi:hypothetical protein CRUP_003267 [Coryphaenoides rupestris]|nr:hypothetical protein CRUP_003267 [Coryphaenoides rupestris]